MARKRKNLEHLDYNSKEYWEKLLMEEHLSMKRGTTSKLSYVGSSTELEIVAQYSGKPNYGNNGTDD
ncbi:MAG: hypothetical protein C5B59_08775 [Bacteroidetes bacterium]|nr:MAG: hypothetical protein C5B59_08775 [Bacteroidota bacterium]